MTHLQVTTQPASPSKALKHHPQAAAGKSTSSHELIARGAQVHILVIMAAIRLGDMKTTTGTSHEPGEVQKSESATRSPSTNAWGHGDLKPATTPANA